MRRLCVVIGSDCDPDREAYGGAPYDVREQLTWDGVKHGVPRARGIADEVAADTGVPVRLTWCVRSDAQMAETYDDPAWPYREFAGMWQGLADAEDEIAWHPHVWRWDDRGTCWYQEREDENWIEECLATGHRALHQHVGDALTTCRMGWEFHNNQTIRAVAAQGIAHDFTAIPDCFSPGESSRGSRHHCFSDWRGTPRQPYRPSCNDYRLGAASSGDALGLIEVPMSVFSSRAWEAVRGLRRSLRMRSPRHLLQALSPGKAPSAIKAYITAPPRLFRHLLQSRLDHAARSSQGWAELVTAFHPDELLPSRKSAAYSAENFETNLRAIASQGRRRRIEPVFLTMNEFCESEEVQRLLGSQMAASDGS